MRCIIQLANKFMVVMKYRIYLLNESDGSYNIHIKKNNEVMPWKKFNSNMAISVEYDLEY